jgi:hypothetical protein
MPKCGSSALQTFLSSEAFLSFGADGVGYAALESDGQIKSGEELVNAAEISQFDYSASTEVEVFAKFDNDRELAAARGLISLLSEKDVVVLSCEGWGMRPQFFSDNCLFSRLGCDVDIVLYTRPQIEWLNTAWWQWGAWADVPFDFWVEHTKHEILWDVLADKWTDKPWVNSVYVRVLSGDIVSDFMSLLGYSGIKGVNANKSLSNSILRLFQRNRSLRKGPHDSKIDFALARNLDVITGKVPFVIERHLVSRLVDYYRESNERLASMLSDEQRQVMLNDNRWWSGGSYDNRKVCNPGPEVMSMSELEDLAVAALKAIVRLDAENRCLRHLASKKGS